MMREKRRYLLVESVSGINENFRKEFELSFLNQLLHNLGEIEYFKANPKIIKYVNSRQFILKCSLAKYRETINAITFIKRLNDREAGFYTLNASGTMRALGKSKD